MADDVKPKPIRPVDAGKMTSRLSPNLRSNRGEKATPYPEGMYRLPSYKKGGTVKKTGAAIVHKGERVIPAKKTAAAPTMGRTGMRKAVAPKAQTQPSTVRSSAESKTARPAKGKSIATPRYVAPPKAPAKKRPARY